MKILLVGSGGREHALAWKLARDGARPDIYCAPGNAGTATVGENIPILAEDIDGLVEWARRARPDLTVVGPEAPLCAGLCDRLQADGRRVFGPCRSGARLEDSKIFTKEILHAAAVPTARAWEFDNAAAARALVHSQPFPIVIKADGLAAGKGVSICHDIKQAEQAISDILIDRIFGAAGQRLLVEECLTGTEVSVLALVDGKRACLLPTAQDHKRVGEDDRGPNTGGMGAFSPAPWDTPDFRGAIMESVFNPTLRELHKRGIDYRGVLYAGLMLTENGPRVLEFNCRFGDPETQAILPRMEKDLIPAMEACIDGTLEDDMPAERPEACACIVLTAEGYPGQYRRGDPISGLDEAGALPDTFVFHAGVKLADGVPVTNGGRVLGVTALGQDPPQAAARAYRAADMIDFAGKYMRRDIAAGRKAK